MASKMLSIYVQNCNTISVLQITTLFSLFYLLTIKFCYIIPSHLQDQINVFILHAVGISNRNFSVLVSILFQTNRNLGHSSFGSNLGVDRSLAGIDLLILNGCQLDDPRSGRNGSFSRPGPDVININPAGFARQIF
jgi:hypothetical protein